MKFRAVLVAIILLSGVFLLPVMSQAPAPSSFAIPEGDWIIKTGESITIDGETVELKGNLTIESGGSLTLRGGAKLIINSTYNGQYKITVKEGGNLNVIDSEVSAPEKDYKGKILYDLHKGLNFISIPFQRENNSVESVLSPLKGHYYKAYIYDASDNNDPWKFYTPGMNPDHMYEMPSYTWKFHTENITPPSVIMSIPENGAEKISLNQNIYIVFNKTMDTDHIPTLEVVSGNDPGGWNFLGWESTFRFCDTAVWSHNNFNIGDVVVLSIDNYRDASGNPGDNYSFSFSTVTDWFPPSGYVVSTNPDFGEVNVNLSQNLTVVFSRQLNTSVIPTITNIGESPDIIWTFAGWGTTKITNDTAIWTHTPFPDSSTIAVSISDYRMADESYNYTTYYLMFYTNDLTRPSIKDVYPLDGESSVDVSTHITVIFDESMDTSVIPEISQSSGKDPGNWTFLGWRNTYLPNDTAVWSHNPWFDFDDVSITVYNYTDKSGNTGLPYAWGFKTGDSRSPGVLEVTPQNLATDVDNSTVVKVTFNSTMNTRVIPHINSSDGGNWTFLGWESTYTYMDTAVWEHENWTSDSDIVITISNYSDLAEINTNEAIIIYMYDNYSFEISGTVESSVSQHLYPGWNTVAYPFIDNSTVEDVFSSVSSYYDSVKTYDDQGNETYLKGTDEVVAGKGYWIHVTEDCLWYVSAYSLLDLERIFPKFLWVYENGSSGNIQNSLISGCGYENSDFPGLSVFSDLVKIGNNEIRNSYAGVYVRDASPIISGNKIYSAHYGIISEDASPIISNNNIYNNRKDGILIKRGYPILSSNSVSFNTGRGISLYDSNSIMEANDVENNLGDGIFMMNSSVLIDSSLIRYNMGGVKAINSNISIKGNTIDGNEVGIRTSYSHVKIEGNTFSLNKNSMIIDNKTEGAISNNSLSSSERAHISCFGGSNPVIYGNIIISGDSGIYVSESEPIIEKNIINHNRGSGVHLQKKSDCRVKNNVISGNGWAGVYVDGSEPVIENNTLSSNDFGVASFNATCRISNNTIYSNKWYGLSFIYSNVFVENSILRMNKWYGILTSYSTFTIQNVTIENSTYQLYLTHNSRGNAINSSVNEETCHLDSTSMLFVKYFLNILVEDTFGNGITNASYLIKDRDGYNIMSGETRYGKAFYIPLTSYIRTSEGIVDMGNPYNLTIEWNNQTFQRDIYINRTVYEYFKFDAIKYSAKEDCGKIGLFNVYEWVPYENNASFLINGSHFTRGHIENGTFFIDPVRNWNGMEEIKIEEVKENVTIGRYVFIVNIIAVNDPPYLEGESAAYSSDKYTTFKITYIDPDNDAPKYVRVVIDGKSYDMVPEAPNDYDYVDGKIYVYTAELKEGVYRYHFEASDGENVTVTEDVELKVEYPLSLPMWGMYGLLLIGVFMMIYVAFRIRKLKKISGEEIDISVGDEKGVLSVHMASSIDTRRSILHRKDGMDMKNVGLDGGSLESKSKIDRGGPVEVAGAPLISEEETEKKEETVESPESSEIEEEEVAEEVHEEKKKKFTRDAFMEIAKKHRKMRVLIEDREKYAKLEPEMEEEKNDESIDEILKTLKGE